MVRRYKGYAVEASSDGMYAQVRLNGDFQAAFRGPTSFADAKRWIEEHLACEQRAVPE